jgi:hypothetical protein
VQVPDVAEAAVGQPLVTVGDRHMHEDRMQVPSEPSTSLAQVVGPALVDRSFREQLTRDRDIALQEFQLSVADREALDSIPPETLDEHAQNSDTGAARITISIVIKGTF